MDDDFMAVMRKTLAAVRAGDPAKGTRLIQKALTPGGSKAGERQSVDAPVAKVRRKTRALSEVVAELARRPPLPAREQRADIPRQDLPEGAVFERGRHEGRHGARNYRLYRPSGDQGRVRGAVMMLHGCTQTPEDFSAGTGMNHHAEQNGLIVIYPEQPRTENLQLCWNWFRPGDQRRDRGEAALLADLANAVMDEHGLTSGRLLVAGLSAGGAMAALLANTHPEMVAAAGVHSGLAPGSAQDVMSAFAAMRGEDAGPAETLKVPSIIFQGSADTTVAPVNAGRLAGPLTLTEQRSGKAASRKFDVLSGISATGHPVEVWRIDGSGHAWSGGTTAGSYTDPAGPDAAAEMVRFFLEILGNEEG